MEASPAAALSFGSVATLLISAGLGYISGLLTSRAQARLEHDKWLRARQDEVHRDIRTAVSAVASNLAALAHGVMWFTYNVSNGRSPDEKAIQAHEDETHRLISDVVGAQVRLAALHPATYERITPSVSEAIHLSENVDAALILLEQNPGRGQRAIIECNAAALTYIKVLPGRIANLIGDASTPSTST
jgi:hypothetical protein